MLNSLTLLKINWWFSHTLTLPLPFQGTMSGLIFSGSLHASFSCDDTIWIKMEGLPPKVIVFWAYQSRAPIQKQWARWIVLSHLTQMWQFQDSLLQFRSLNNLVYSTANSRLPTQAGTRDCLPIDDTPVSSFLPALPSVTIMRHDVNQRELTRTLWVIAVKIRTTRTWNHQWFFSGMAVLSTVLSLR